MFGPALSGRGDHIKPQSTSEHSYTPCPFITNSYKLYNNSSTMMITNTNIVQEQTHTPLVDIKSVRHYHAEYKSLKKVIIVFRKTAKLDNSLTSCWLNNCTNVNTLCGTE